MIALHSLLPLPVVVPLTGAALAPLAARFTRRAPLVVALVALLGAAGILLAMAPGVYGGHLLVEFIGHAPPVRGHVLGIAFAADAWGLTFALVTALLGTVLALYTLSELSGLGKRELGGFSALFLLLCAALIGAALTADLFNLFVWFEVAAIASYALTGFFLERPIALEAAFKILVLTTIAGFAIFIGAGLIYARHGALDFAQIHNALAAHTYPADLAALGLLTAGFATKAGLVPFHGWL
ncbi:MAG: proton-conducting transporter membrane subunit, partial [Acidimicrobiales bacterium]